MTVRSNENRLGNIPDPPRQQNNELGLPPPPMDLKFITPTEFVDLPSRGKFYPPQHPLHNKDTIEIKHMTTKEEDILTSTTLLKKGIALDRVLESVMVDKSININDLLIGDKNALVIAARAHGYGTIYETTISCPKCDTSQKYSFDLDSFPVQYPEEDIMEEYNVERTEHGTYLIPLPRTHYTVEVKFLTGHDEIKAAAISDHKKKRDFPETIVSDFLRLAIVSVNSTTHESALNEFIATLPALHGRYLRKVYEKLVPSIKMNHPFTCEECNHEGTMEVPLNADFFWFDA